MGMKSGIIVPTSLTTAKVLTIPLKRCTERESGPATTLSTPTGAITYIGPAKPPNSLRMFPLPNVPNLMSITATIVTVILIRTSPAGGPTLKRLTTPDVLTKRVMSTKQGTHPLIPGFTTLPKKSLVPLQYSLSNVRSPSTPFRIPKPWASRTVTIATIVTTT